MEAFESRVLDLPDFYFTGDDYRYRFEPEARQRFIDLIRERFNSGASYKGRVLKWDTIIEQKATELGRMLVNGAHTVDFAEPELKLVGFDELRARILSLGHSEARQLGVGKSTLHYLKSRAGTKRRFMVYRKIQAKLT